MIISLINHTNGKISDTEVQEVVRAINRQLQEDFLPIWSIFARLRLEGRSGKKPSKQDLADMRGDAVLYLWDGSDVEDAVGYHDTNNRGIPYGFVFTNVAKELGEKWSSTLSHEALELAGDPEANLLVMGPHPTEKSRTVFHWFEMCDAVQDETYEIDGVRVSNFVLPLYFTEGNEAGSRNDFLGTLRKDGTTLPSFGVNPGGYVGFYDPKTEDIGQVMADQRAKARWAIKRQSGKARRGVRYTEKATRQASSSMRKDLILPQAKLETPAKPTAASAPRGKPSATRTRG